jgi:hypothetical protein
LVLIKTKNCKYSYFQISDIINFSQDEKPGISITTPASPPITAPE